MKSNHANLPALYTRHRARLLAVAATAALLAAPATAAYMQYGADPVEIQAAEIPNGALFLQASNTWLATTPVKPVAHTADFALPVCERIDWARLYFTLWGGTRDYTCSFKVYLNDTNRLIAAMTIGTTNDANAAFVASTNCAYGLGFGVWLVSVPVAAGTLPLDGSTNTILTVMDTPDSFDGRQIHATLAAVYQDRALNNTFTYRVAEGPADIYRGTAGAVSSRQTAFSAVTTGEVAEARLWALYTYGASGEKDRLLLNDVTYGGDDVANKQNNNPAFSQVPDLNSYAVTNLAVSNTVRFSVNTNEIAGTCESSLRPHLALLTVRQPPALRLYEPALDDSGTRLSWPGASGWVYRVETCASLATQNWQPLAGATNLAGTNAVMSAIDPSAAPGARVYRITRTRP